MKLADKVSRRPVPLEVNGQVVYMRALTMGQLKVIQEKLSTLEDNTEDLTPLMVIFTDVLVDEDGEQYDEIKEGKTFDEICEVIPINFLMDISNAVSDALQGKNSGN